MLVAIFVGFIFVVAIIAAWVVTLEVESICTQDCNQGRACTCCNDIKALETRRKFEDECG